VDALVIAFQATASESFRLHLAAALETAKECGAPFVEVAVGGMLMALDARSHLGWLRLSNGDATAVISDDRSLRGWNVEVTMRAVTLAALGHEAAAALAVEIGENIIGRSAALFPTRVRRLDLCVDVVGLDLRTIPPTAWVGRGRPTLERLTPNIDAREFFVGGECNAFYFGTGDLLLRAYNKTVELQKDLVGSKCSLEHELWRAAGWNETDDVTRIEFQLRSEALKTIDGGSLRHTPSAFERLDAAWAYLTNEWARIGVPGSSSRRTRWRTDPRWSVVQSADFGRATGEIAVRSARVRDAPAPEYVAAILLSYGAKTGALEPTLRMLDEDLEAEAAGEEGLSVTALMVAAACDAAERAATDLVGRRGADGAKRLVFVKIKAASAKAWRADPYAEAME
jgi:hypothetical protein